MIKRLELLEPIEKDLEINAIYNAKYGKDVCLAELLYIGTKVECEKVIGNLIKQTNSKASKSAPKSSTNEKESSKGSNKKPSVSDESKKKLDENNNTVESYLKQLEDRNQLLSNLREQKEEDQLTIQSLKEQLEVYTSINSKTQKTNFKISQNLLYFFR